MIKLDHLFHFKISPIFNERIDYLKENFNLKSSCKLVDYILELSSKNIPNIKKIIGNHKSEYEYIDAKDIIRIDKYVRLKPEKCKMLKKWHYKFNEFGISVILRDIITFFYEGVIKYGVDKFLNMIVKKINVKKIKDSLR